MNWYLLLVIMHLLAVSFWLGHMVFWTFVVGPITRQFSPPATGQSIKQMSLRWGGLGWPALFVLALTGVMLLSARGVTLQSLFSRELYASPFGRILGIKLLLVTMMALYQVLVGHRSAPGLVMLNIIIAFLIIALSIILIRAPTLIW
jgi:uncharacterized membrane protein